MRNLILFLFIVLLSNQGFNQITRERLSPVFENTESRSSISVMEIDKPDLTITNQEDKIAKNNKEIPWRFGVHIPQEISIRSHGEWSSVNGWSRWVLSIKSKDAISLNLNFNKFYLTEDAELIIYNQNGIAEIEVLSQLNNKIDSLFSTRPILGEELRLELLVPSNQKNRLKLEISGVVYGYRNIYQKLSKTFNASGPCNVNINCEEGEKWQTIKRAVAVITLNNNTTTCTGTLINNVRKDSTPYFLTATHCPVQNNSVTIFGYESPNCSPNTDGSKVNSISGNIPRALSVRNDFRLVELSSTPPSTYNVFYAGWSALPSPNNSSTSIHHPQGDVKKISFDEDTLISSSYNGGPANTHWGVGFWEVGTTESGSSGSPLFDNKKRIIGQLHGGSASCLVRASDFYGKFSESWSFSNQSNEQLKFWLDPDTTNVLVLDGLDPNSKSLNHDVELDFLLNIPPFTCDTFIDVRLITSNAGNNSINSLLIKYGTNKSYPFSFNWTGNIRTDSVIEISIPRFSLSSSDTLINIKAELVGVSDQDSSNNILEKAIIVNDIPESITLTLKTDQYGNETSWEILDSNSVLLYKGGPYEETSTTQGRTYTETLCLYDSCFIFNLYDSFGDGFSGFFGNGSLLIQNQKADTLVYIGNFTRDKISRSFCINNSASFIGENKIKLVKIFPNPVKRGDYVRLDNQEQPFRVQLIDFQGRLILEENNTNRIRIPSQISEGIYLVKLLDIENHPISLNKLIVN